jgi:hypothetical protein
MNDYCYFFLGMMVGGVLGVIFMALMTGSREKRWWEGKIKGGMDEDFR